MGIQRALKAIGGTSWAGETLNAETAGNSEVTLVHFWTVSQAWESLAPTPTLWRLVGSGANGGGGEQARKGAVETKYSTGSQENCGSQLSPILLRTPRNTLLWSHLHSHLAQHLGFLDWGVGHIAPSHFAKDGSLGFISAGTGGSSHYSEQGRW